jgi:hypothetical protein
MVRPAEAPLIQAGARTANGSARSSPARRRGIRSPPNRTHFRRSHRPRERAALVGVLRTTLRLEPTGGTHPAASARYGCCPAPGCGSWPACRCSGPTAWLSRWPSDPDEVHALGRQRHAVLPTGEAPVAHPLRRLLFPMLLHPFHPADPLPVVAAARANPRPHEDPVRGVGAPLHVGAGRLTSRGRLPDPRLRVAQAHPCPSHPTLRAPLH